ncbi:MAG: N-acetyltransferase [Candidatus Omnitrophica bacterium]|nr:N-acetyltransferase [Candidatus Omnitrophota bacterium]
MARRTQKILIRRPTVADIPAIQDLIKDAAQFSKVLPRSLNNLYEHVRDFFVAECAGNVCGCCALQISGSDLAEIRSLVVRDDRRGRGIARRLMDACVRDAASVGVKKIFCLTEIPAFFERFGFKKINKAKLPQKIWTDCIHCVQFPDCCETALMRDVSAAAARHT